MQPDVRVLNMLSLQLNGRRIVLQRLQPDNVSAEEIFALVDANREHLRILPWVRRNLSAQDSLCFLQSSHQAWEDNKKYEYGIYLQNNLIGLAGVVVADWNNKKAELGYWLGADYCGAGYVSEAVGLLEAELFAKGFNKIIIHTDVLNTASAAVAKRCGYELEAVLKQDRYIADENRFRDTNCFVKFKI